MCSAAWNTTTRMRKEIVEEIFVQLFRDIAGYDGVQPPCRWMLGIARNRIVDHYGAKGRKPVVELLFAVSTSSLRAGFSTWKRRRFPTRNWSDRSWPRSSN